MTTTSSADLVALRHRRDYLRHAEERFESAGNVASGMGLLKLANDNWAVASRLKDERTGINARLAEANNPDYPRKRGDNGSGPPADSEREAHDGGAG